MLGLSKLHTLIAAVALVAALLGGLWAYGRSQYNDGADDKFNELSEKDRKGADHVDETVDETLRRIGPDPDGDELLRATGGLRPD